MKERAREIDKERGGGKRAEEVEREREREVEKDKERKG